MPQESLLWQSTLYESLVAEHLKKYPVAEHFNGEGHTCEHDCCGYIDKQNSHNYSLCKIWESWWIRTLGTLHTFGMNLKVDSLGPLGILQARSIDTKATGYPKNYM